MTTNERQEEIKKFVLEFNEKLQNDYKKYNNVKKKINNLNKLLKYRK